MKNLTHIKTIKEYIEQSLLEISRCNDFNKGQLHAYVEVLELLQSQLSESERAKVGLDYFVEGVYPLE